MSDEKARVNGSGAACHCASSASSGTWVTANGLPNDSSKLCTASRWETGAAPFTYSVRFRALALPMLATAYSATSRTDTYGTGRSPEPKIFAVPAAASTPSIGPSHTSMKGPGLRIV